MLDPKEKEEHPLLPSGTWVGFYVYAYSKDQHKMNIDLHFNNNQITGRGTDDVGAFSFRGQYDLDKMKCHWTKYYSGHIIEYQGDIDENGIWGTWQLGYNNQLEMDKSSFNRLMQVAKPHMTGGFHIWPDQMSFIQAAAQEKAKTAQKVIELVN